jgi:hypothetical protein
MMYLLARDVDAASDAGDPSYAPKNQTGQIFFRDAACG